MTAYSGAVVSDRDHRRNLSAKLDWLSEAVMIADRLDRPDTTAIIHPRKFTSAS
jgi:hypothetical protein